MSKHTSKLVMPGAIGSAHAGNHRPRSVMNFAIRLAVLSALAGSISAAQAALVLPAATSFVACDAVADANSCAVSNATSNAAASVTRAPAVELTASSSHSAGFFSGDAGVAIFTYSFAVLGGTLDTVVPVNIDFALQATSTNGVSLADIVANTPQSAKEAEICSEATGCSFISTNLAGTLHVSVFAGEANGNTISLRIQAGEEGSVDIASATAYAASWLYVDPTFANAGAYSIVLSDGVGNSMAAAVPEPETCVLMLAGLGALAWVARRRRATR